MSDRAEAIREAVAKHIHSREKDEGIAVTWWDDMPAEHREMYAEEARLNVRALIEAAGLSWEMVDRLREIARETRRDQRRTAAGAADAIAAILEAGGIERE